MMIRVLKYDLKKIFKFLSVFFLLALFFAALTRFFDYFGNSIALEFVKGFCNGAMIAMLFNIVINCVMRSWVLFRSCFYGDESYLTHTLPIKRQTHYASKTITGLLSMLACFAVILLSLIIAYASKENMTLLKTFLSPVTASFDVSWQALAVILILILFVEFFNVLEIGFLGLIVGHRSNSSKIVISLVTGFVVYMISQFALLLVMLLVGLADSDIMLIFKENNLFLMKPDTARAVVMIALGVYSSFCVFWHFLNTALLKKGVNVD